MGCAPSNLDQLPAVALCRDRNKSLHQALRQTQSLSDAHVAYLQSLRTLGPSLSRFFEDRSNSPNTSSASDSNSNSNSGSGSGSAHIEFSCSDSESEDDDNKHSVAESSPTPTRPYSDSHSRGVVLTSHFSKTPPPPPSPISATWDFLNLFDDVYDRYESIYAYNWQLPDDDDKIGTKIDGGENPKNVEEKEQQKSELTEKKKKKKKSVSAESSNVSVEAENKVENGVVEAMKELQLQFERASQSGNEVLKLISHTHYYKAISLQPDSSFDQEDAATRLQSLCYTLETLSLWEKKLYDEVKAAELLCVTHEKKCRMLKHVDNKGGESPKADAMHDSLSNLLTKMKIAIQIVDRISTTISKLRDEELWPQLIELINRLLGMWKAMLECHKLQYQTISEAKGLDAIASKFKYCSDDHLETVIQLKIELQNWSLCFSNWITTQKGCIKALNGWLQRCLLTEPEDKQDDVAPLSPSRITRMGAPPIFVICNQWSRAMDRFSEKEVIEAIQKFQASIDLVLEQHNVELQKRIIENNDFGRKVKLMEELQQKMHKVMQAGRGKRFGLLGGEESKVSLTGERLPNENSSISRKVDGDLKHILMAMEKFTTNSMEAYKELHTCIEGVRQVDKCDKPVE